MDLGKMNNADRLKLCRQYFFIGFVGLPFLWLVGTFWFGSYLLGAERKLRRESKAQSDGQNGVSSDAPPHDALSETRRHLADLRFYVIASSIGTLLWIGVIVAWFTTFQLMRAQWGEFADSISFNIPRGIP